VYTRVRAVGAVAVFAAVLSGCSGDEPAPAPTTSASATAEATPTQSAPPTAPAIQPPPTLPPEATTQDAAGAEAFVRHWFDLVNYGYNTGDTDPLQAASSSLCIECDSYVERILEVTGFGSYIEGKAIIVSEVMGGIPDSSGRAPVEVTYAQGTLTLVDEQGTSSSFSADPNERALAYVDVEPGTWTMIGLAIP